MKFYIASSIRNKKKVRRILRKLREAKHSVTVDWTKSNHIHEKDRNKNTTMLKKIALRDYQGISKSDVFILLSTPPQGRSMYVELGIALANLKLNGNPSIYVVGGESNQSIFYYHPNVKRISSIDKIFSSGCL